MFDKKKKIWFAKFFYLQKSRFENKTQKKMDYQTNPINT